MILGTLCVSVGLVDLASFSLRRHSCTNILSSYEKTSLGIPFPDCKNFNVANVDEILLV